MKRWIVIILVMYAGLLFSANIDAQSRYTWREYSKELPEQTVNNPRTTDGIEIYTRPGVLIIHTPVRATVRVLSILGQTLSQAVIQPGTFELPIGTHGIFIVRAGDNTIRVAL